MSQPGSPSLLCKVRGTLVSCLVLMAYRASVSRDNARCRMAHVLMCVASECDSGQPLHSEGIPCMVDLENLGELVPLLDRVVSAEVSPRDRGGRRRPPSLAPGPLLGLRSPDSYGCHNIQPQTLRGGGPSFRLVMAWTDQTLPAPPTTIHYVITFEPLSVPEIAMRYLSMYVDVLHLQGHIASYCMLCRNSDCEATRPAAIDPVM
ncbi:hypothetical protein JB92DRAFT_2947176 [Gautieria morchelliformis]|nr:hypothetical protein JB92DRAFT_2947176 [Gautieria morchelliformis]